MDKVDNEKERYGYTHSSSWWVRPDGTIEYMEGVDHDTWAAEFLGLDHDPEVRGDDPMEAMGPLLEKGWIRAWLTGNRMVLQSGKRISKQKALDVTWSICEKTRRTMPRWIEVEDPTTRPTRDIDTQALEDDMSDLTFRSLVDAALLEAAYSMTKAEARAFFIEQGWQESVEDIHVFYKRMVRKLHPDAPGGSHELMAKLNGAYDTLNAPDDPGQDAADNEAGGGYGSYSGGYWTPDKIRAAALVVRLVPAAISLIAWGYSHFRDRKVSKFASHNGYCPPGYYDVTDAGGKTLAGCAQGKGGKGKVIFLSKSTRFKPPRKRAVNEHIGSYVNAVLDDAIGTHPEEN